MAAGFVLGEVLALRYQVVMPGLLSVMALLAVTGAGVLWARSVAGRRERWISPLLICIVFALSFFTGYGNGGARVRQLDKEAELAETFAGGRGRIEGRISHLEEKEDKWVFSVEDAGVTVGKKKGEFGKVLAYVKKAEEPVCLAVGQEVSLFGSLEGIQGPKNPGEFDARSYYRSKGTACRFFGDKLLEVSGEGSPYFKLLSAIRGECSRIIGEICEPEDGMIYRAMLLGETGAMDGEIKTMYQKNGIAHLLAISGQHLSLIGGGIYVVLRLAGLGYGKAAAVGSVLVVSYGIMTGGSGSAMRAVIMILCMWTAAWAGRTYDTLSALSLAAIVLVWDHPYLLMQSGFLLSFGAVGAIGGLGRWAEEAFFVEKGWQKTVLISLCVQIVLTPVVLWFYYEHPLYGILLNLLVIPLVPVLMYSGLLVIGIGSVWSLGGRMAAGAGHYVLDYYEGLCALAERLPGHSLVLGRPGLWQLTGYTAVAAGGLLAAGWQNKRKKEGSRWQLRGGYGVLLAGGLNLGGFLFLFPAPVQGLEVLCMDVGQGDGFLLSTGKSRILVDGGSSSEKKLGEMTLLPCLKSKGISRLDYAVVSHGDSDHISGLKTLLEEPGEITIGTLILPALGKGQEIYEGLSEQQLQNGGRVWYMKPGERLAAGALSMTCLYGGNPSRREDRNSHSLVICADYGEFHMLFTGDMGIKEEKELLEQSKEPGPCKEHLQHVNVLKTAHHGSDGSTSGEFLDALSSKIGVLSYGEGNSYGHPADRVVEEMKMRGIRVLETGGTGAVEMWSDGVVVEVIFDIFTHHKKTICPVL